MFHWVKTKERYNTLIASLRITWREAIILHQLEDDHEWHAAQCGPLLSRRGGQVGERREHSQEIVVISCWISRWGSGIECLYSDTKIIETVNKNTGWKRYWGTFFNYPRGINCSLYWRGSEPSAVTVIYRGAPFFLNACGLNFNWYLHITVQKIYCGLNIFSFHGYFFLFPDCNNKLREQHWISSKWTATVGSSLADSGWPLCGTWTYKLIIFR